MPSSKASRSWSFGLCLTHSCSIFPISGIQQLHDIVPVGRVPLLRQSLESTALENPLKTDLPCFPSSDCLPTTLVTARRLMQMSGKPSCIKMERPGSCGLGRIFFFLSRLSFSNTLLLKHTWKNPKLFIYKAFPPHWYKFTYALPFKLNLKQFFSKHKNYLFYI